MKKLLLLITLFTLYTHNSYSQWIQQTVPVSKPITGIKFIDANTGWACTSIGMGGQNYAYILHTTNGGTNWFIQDSSFNSDYNALSVVDANIVYAGGDSVGFGKLAKTTNGGINWIYLQLPINMLIGDMQFLNKDSGWTCVDLFGADVRTTTDGGATWQVRISGIAAQTQRIFFLNYSTGFCGANFDLYKTTNAGMNWTISSSFSQSLQSIFFLNGNTGWLGLSPSGSARVAYTTNGGANWMMQFLQPYNTSITDIIPLNSQIIYACIPTGLGKIYKTTDAGLNWGYQNITTGSYKMSFIDTSNGWVGNNGISHTTNGGGPITYTGINNLSTEIPSSYRLYQNYPNPFNPVTTIRVDIAESSNISFIIYDLLGSELYREDRYLKTGSYSFSWDASKYSSGTYFYRLISDKYTETRKMLLVK